MKSACLLVACCGLIACSTQPSAPAGSAAAPDAVSVVSSCPERVGTDMHTQLPAPHFLPDAPPGATLVLPERLRVNTPAYPAGSMRCREQGKVTITYCVSADGSVENVQVVISSSYARLDNAMLAWAATDRHRPGTVNGQPRRYCGLAIERSFEIERAPIDQAARLTVSGAR